jgi:hypothetical protein
MKILTAEEKRIRHNQSQKKHYYFKKSGNIRKLLTPIEKRLHHNRNQKKHVYPKIYGITIYEYDSLFITQQKRCAICGTHQNQLIRPLGVDHDHKTGKVRGLLCSNCNLILGYSKDNIQILKNTIKYLKKNF